MILYNPVIDSFCKNILVVLLFFLIDIWYISHQGFTIIIMWLLLIFVESLTLFWKFIWNFFIKNIWLSLSLAKTGCKSYKHTQTICRFLLRICLSVYDLFRGARDKGLRMSILTFFLTNSILMHCYYAFFTRPNVTFYWNLCYSIIPKI